MNGLMYDEVTKEIKELSKKYSTRLYKNDEFAVYYKGSALVHVNDIEQYELLTGRGTNQWAVTK